MEWIDPRYADLVEQLRAAEAEAEETPPEGGRLRGFIVPDADPGPRRH